MFFFNMQHHKLFNEMIKLLGSFKYFMHVSISITKTMPMRYTEIFKVVKNENFLWKFLDIYAQNIDCGYTLEPPRRDGSNEYPQSMFWSKNKKNRYAHAYPSFTI